MPTVKLNRRFVTSLKPVERVTYYWDADLTGFGLRVMPSGVATWLCEYRPGAGGRGAQKKRVKIARLDSATPPEKARDAARLLLANVVATNADPARKKREARAGVTVRKLIDDYVSIHVAEKRKATTRDYYDYLLRVHIDPAMGTVRAAEVTHADVLRLHTAIGKRGRYVSNRVLALISAAYRWGAKTGLVPKAMNPASGVERYTEEGSERFLTSEEIERLGEALRTAETTGLPYAVDATKAKAKHAAKAENRLVVFPPHATGAIRLLMLTGARLREILHLEWSQIDFERGIAFLPDSKTGRKPVILSTAAIDLLSALPRVGRYVIAGDTAGTKDERPRSDLKRPWRAISKAAGLGGVRIHDLRHTFASVGAGSGLGLPAIGGLLGHASPKTTQRYAHVATEQSRAAADLIAGKIAEALK